MEDIYDITIIGSGPVGLFAAFYAGMRGLKTKVIDSMPEVGGQLSLLYPEKYIYDVPGFAAIKAKHLIRNLKEQLTPFSHAFCLGEQVHLLEKTDEWFTITTNKGTHFSKAVLIAAGNGSFQPRKLAVEGAANLEGKGLEYFVKDLSKYEGSRVAIAGGGDSAIDWALMLEPIAEKVSLIHRRNKFRGHEHSIQKLMNSNVEILTPYAIDALVTNGKHLKGVHLQKIKEEEQLTLEADYLIVNYGFSSTSDQFEQWGLETADHAIKVASDMSTSIPGIYAIGDVNTYTGKIKLIASGFGEAPTAVNNAAHFIQPLSRIQPAHSSSLGAHFE